MNEKLRKIKGLLRDFSLTSNVSINIHDYVN